MSFRAVRHRKNIKKRGRNIADDWRRLRIIMSLCRKTKARAIKRLARELIPPE